MSYLYKREDLLNFQQQIQKNHEAWNSNLDSLRNSMQSIIGSQQLKGKGPDSAKLYLKTVHSKIIDSLKELLDLHKGQISAYVEHYQKSIDQASDARIEDDELEVIKKEIRAHNNSAQRIDTDLSSVLRSVMDLFQIGRTGADDIYQAHDKIIQDIDTTETDIKSLESSYKAQLQETENLILSAKKVIEEFKGKDRSFISGFNAASVGQISSWAAFTGAAVVVEQKYQDNKDVFDQAEANVNQEIKEVEDRKKREEQVKWIKFAVGAACAVLSTAVIIGSGGTAAPLVLGTVGAISSMASTATDKLGDEYIEKGNLNNVNWNDLCLDVGVAGAVGFISGYAGGAVDKIGVLSKGMKSSNWLIRYGASACKGSLKSIQKGVIKRTGEEFGKSVKTGEWDIVASAKRVLNPKEVGKDFAVGGVQGTTDSIFNSVSKGFHVDSRGLNNNNKSVREITGFMQEGGKETLTGIEERYLRKRMDGYTVSESFSEAFDASEIAGDYFKGGIKGGTDAYKGKPVGDVVSESKFGRGDMKIYRDSSGNRTYKYTYSDRKHGGKNVWCYDTGGNLKWSASSSY